MSDSHEPGDLPPDLPPEYAEAYRRGYARGYESFGKDPEEALADDWSAPVPTPDPARGAEVAAVGQTRAGEPVRDDPPYAAGATDHRDTGEATATAAPHREPAGGTEAAPAPADPSRTSHDTRREPSDEPTRVSGPLFAPDQAPRPLPPPPKDDYDEIQRRLEDAEGDRWDRPSHRTDDQRPSWFVPAILAALALLLLVGAYVVGKLFTDSISDASSSQTPSGNVLSGSNTGTSTGAHRHPATGSPYRGAISAASIASASASCQAPDAVDASGRTIGYAPANVFDGDVTTAWRCNNDGVGQRLTLTFGSPTKVGQVGLVPGYAKTDPTSGADRYAENDRITKVRWVFDDGSTVVQTFSGSPTDRSMRTIRVPLTRTRTLVIEILATTPGPRHTTAISEVTVGAGH